MKVLNRKMGLWGLALALFFVGLLFVSVPQPAQAMPGIHLYTTYPGIKIKPGQTVNFTIEIRNTNSTERIVPLRLTQVPEDWDVQLTGNSWVIREALVRGNDSQNITLKVDVPADTATGTYPIHIEAGSESDPSRLEIQIEVTEEGGSTATISTQYPNLSGPSGAEFKFQIQLNNNTAQDQLFGLSAEAPRGWFVTFQPAYEDKQIASISIEANTNKSVNVLVTPPKDAKAGEYVIPIMAQSPQASARTELRVDITGSYDLQLRTADDRLNARAVAGQESTLPLKVTNTGSTDLQNVQLSASAPANWTITFEPETIDQIAAGETVDVKAIIKPHAQAIAGDYALSLRASNESASDGIDIRVNVRTSTLWGIVGLAIVLVVAGGVVYLFRNYGRR